MGLILCKDCEFWRDDNPMEGPDRNGLRMCLRITRAASYTPVGLDGSLPSNAAATSYGYDLVTGPDFGCVLGEPKE